MKTPVRIFVSSSFREMTDERDILARRVVPSLRDECDTRNVDLQVVDLRWGVPEEQPLSIEMLDRIVGSEIGRASVFVSLIGKRFGWVPPREYDSTIALEIYRAIAKPSLNLLAFWRDPTANFLFEGAADPNELEQEKLIRRLRWLGVPLHKYASHDEFAEMSHAAIRSLLEELYFSKLGAIFLSYSRKDTRLAEEIAGILRTLRFNVWQDTTSVETGANWTEQLATGIEESDVVLFLASLNSASSPYCSKEIAHATNLRRPMITVHIDDAELPKQIAFLVSDSQHLRLSQHISLDAAVAEVSRAAQRLISEGKRLTGR